MPKPIVLITRHTIRPGKLDEFRELMRQGAAWLQAANPGRSPWWATSTTPPGI